MSPSFCSVAAAIDLVTLLAFPLKALWLLFLGVISKYSSWTILCAHQICDPALASLRASSAARYCPSLLEIQAFGHSTVRAIFRSILRGLHFVSHKFVLQPLLIFACLVSSNAQAIAPTRRPFGAGSVRASGSRALCDCDLRGLYCVPNDSVLQPLQSCMPALCAVASFCQNSAASCLYFVPNEPVL